MVTNTVLVVREGIAASERGEDGVVLTVTPRVRARTVELIPALLVMLLNDSGKLPDIPNLPTAGVRGFRKPVFADMESVKWLAVWEGSRTDSDGFRKVAGLATYRDIYDWHRSADVREILALRGSRRSIVALVRHLVASAIEDERLLVGAVQEGDVALIHLLERLGGEITRFFMEYAA